MRTRKRDISGERKTCQLAECGTVFGPNDWELVRPSKWERRQYCSQRCGNAAAANSHHLGDRNVVEEKTCAECGAVFRRERGTARERFRAQVVCGRACAAVRARRAQERGSEKRLCALESCGQEIPIKDGETKARWRKRKYHSDECRNAARRLANAEKARAEGREVKPKPKSPPVPRRVVKLKTQGASGLPVFPGPEPTTIWRPASWGGPIPKPGANDTAGAGTDERAAS